MGEKKIIATNKTAGYRYDISEKIEAGIELRGTEVKSLRKNKLDLKDSFARVERGELILYNLHISPYFEGSYNNPDPRRPRRLLVHRKQIDRLMGLITQKGLTLVPVSVYFNADNRAKLELAVGKGRKLYDQREKIKKKEVDRQLRKAVSVKR